MYIFKSAVVGWLLMFAVEASAGFTTWAKIDQVVVHDHLGVMLVLNHSEAAASQGCIIKNQVVISPDHYLFETAVSLALSAFHAESTARMWTTKCVTSGSHTYPQATRIDIKK
ncbi:hypothetical protein [Neptunomonas phycophila]|uniref:hypothetical protein n=1 Tax=Neptunomonas phycophila TaxID=1572645 RepID=UPI0015C0DF0B|nr:hypothetical protein [Neptunomonas phycophila]QLE98924.1 hypothetical protein FLM49_15515 [Neptunomonas phycophila]